MTSKRQSQPSSPGAGAEPVLGIDELLAEKITSERAVLAGYQLVDRRQRFLAVVQKLVAHRDRESLVALEAGFHAVHKMLTETASSLTRVRALTGKPYDSKEVAPVHAARALAALGLVLVDEPDRRAGHLEIFRRWITVSGLLIPDDGPVREFPPMIAPEHLPVVRELVDSDELDLTSAVWLAELGSPPRTRQSPGIRPGPGVQVLLDLGHEGRRAVLSLSRIPRLPRGLVADPASMALSSADEHFRSSLATAWRVAGSSTTDTVLWSLTDRAGPVMRVTQESLSLAFAVLFEEQRRTSRPVRGPLTVRRLRARTAIVGRIDPGAPDLASSVSGYPAKLSATDSATRVLVPLPDYAAATEANRTDGTGAELVPVRTWRQAAKSGRSIDRRRLSVILAVVLLVATSLTYAWSEHRAREREAAQAADQTLDAAGTSTTLRERLLIDLRAANVASTTRVDSRAYDDYLSLQHTTRVLQLDSSAETSWVVSPDGRSMAVTNGGQGAFAVYSLDVGGGDRTFPLGDDAILASAISFIDPDRVVVSAKHGPSIAGEDTIEVWNIKTGVRERRIIPRPGQYSLDPPNTFMVGNQGHTLAFSQPGSRTVSLIALDGSDRSVDLSLKFDLATRPEAGGPVVRAVPDADTMLVGAGRVITRISPTGVSAEEAPYGMIEVSNQLDDWIFALCRTFEDGVQQLVQGTSTARVYRNEAVDSTVCKPGSMGVDTSARYITSAYSTHSGHPDVISILPADGRTPDRRFAVPEAAGKGRTWKVTTTAFADDGSGRVVLVDDDTVVAIDIPPTASLDSAVAASENVRFSPNGEVVYIQLMDGTVQAWATGTRSLLHTAGTPHGRVSSDAFKPRSMTISPDGAYVAVTGFENTGPAAVVTVLNSHNLEFADKFETNQFGTSIPVELVFADDHHLVARTNNWTINSRDVVARKDWHSLLELPNERSQGAPIGIQYTLPVGDDVVLVLSNGEVRRIRLADGSQVPGSSFRLPYTSAELVAVGLDSDATTLVVALADRVEAWGLHGDHAKQEDLPVTGRVAGLRVTDSGDVVQIRMAADVQRPEDLPAARNITYPYPSGPDLFTWDRSGWLGIGSGNSSVSDGGLLYRVVPAPALTPADVAERQAAACRALGQDDLAGSRASKLPAEARTPACR